MKLPNLITSARIAMSPAFFVVYFLPDWTGTGRSVCIALLWLLLGLIELSDLVDGKIARRMNEVSDLGKLLDPFADSLSRLTYFFCFSTSGLMFPLLFLVILYRDLSVSFIRLLMARKGVAMAARMSGKIKAWVYAISGIGGMAYNTLSHFSPGPYLDSVRIGVNIVFIVTAATAVWSLLDYLTPLKKTSDNT